MHCIIHIHSPIFSFEDLKSRSLPCSAEGYSGNDKLLKNESVYASICNDANNRSIYTSISLSVRVVFRLSCSLVA